MHNPDLMLSILCAQRPCASSVMHDGKNTVNLILDFCTVLEYFWQMGPDWSGTRLEHHTCSRRATLDELGISYMHGRGLQIEGPAGQGLRAVAASRLDNGSCKPVLSLR